MFFRKNQAAKNEQLKKPNGLPQEAKLADKELKHIAGGGKSQRVSVGVFGGRGRR